MQWGTAPAIVFVAACGGTSVNQGRAPEETADSAVEGAAGGSSGGSGRGDGGSTGAGGGLGGRSGASSGGATSVGAGGAPFVADAGACEPLDCGDGGCPRLNGMPTCRMDVVPFGPAATLVYVGCGVITEHRQVRDLGSETYYDAETGAWLGSMGTAFGAQLDGCQGTIPPRCAYQCTWCPSLSSLPQIPSITSSCTPAELPSWARPCAESGGDSGLTCAP